MIPDGSEGYQVVAYSQKQIEHKEQIESEILQAYAVVDPWRMMINMKNASIANGAMSCADRFNVHAFTASRYPRG